MNVRAITGTCLFGWFLGNVISTSPAQAQQYFVGAYLFSADTNGATATTAYQYDTNDGDVASTLNINGAVKDISFALSAGDNTFTFDQTLNDPLSHFGTNGDLGLFFSSTNVPYNISGIARVPDLLVSQVSTGAASFFVPISGTTINDYHYSSGGGGGTLSANGALNFTLGNSVISVTAFNISDKPSGSFNLRVSPIVMTPEPGGLALLTSVGLSGTLVALRRRRKQLSVHSQKGALSCRLQHL